MSNFLKPTKQKFEYIFWILFIGFISLFSLFFFPPLIFPIALIYLPVIFIYITIGVAGLLTIPDLSAGFLGGGDTSLLGPTFSLIIFILMFAFYTYLLGCIMSVVFGKPKNDFVKIS